MKRASFLWILAAVCNFVSAAFAYYDGGRALIVLLQLFAGALMIWAAIKFSRKR
jgi:hypothetical protein